MNFDPNHDKSASFISKHDGWVLHYVQLVFMEHFESTRSRAHPLESSFYQAALVVNIESLLD